jgi:hypothetical protein
MRLLADLLAAVAATTALAGCFSPSEREGAIACGEDNVCPPGYQCYLGDMRCYRDPPDGIIDAAVVDGGTPDAAGMSDAAAPDASAPPTAEMFCDQYEPVCTYQTGPNRYDDRDQCLAAYEGYSDDRRACVAAHLDLAEAGQMTDDNCKAATGKDPCI